MFHPNGPSFFELARQALSSTERGYDLLAEKFDWTPFRTPDRVLHSVSDLISAWGRLETGLDVCCGTGAGIEMLLGHCQLVTGVDFSLGMLQVAEKKLAQYGDRVELSRQDVLDMDWGGRQFDLAVCFGALGHILPRDEDRFLSRISACLKPGGRFLFVTSSKPPINSMNFWLSSGFNAAMHVRNVLIRPPFIMYYMTFLWPQIREKLNRHGFAVECVTTFPAEPRLSRVKTVIATKIEDKRDLHSND